MVLHSQNSYEGPLALLLVFNNEMDKEVTQPPKKNPLTRAALL